MKIGTRSFVVFGLLISCYPVDRDSINYGIGNAVNHYDSTAEVVLDSIGLHYQTLDEIVNNARDYDSTSTPPVSAWKYVISRSSHGYPMSSEDWLSDPTLFVNSVCWGFCDDVADVLAQIWAKMGYSARVWQLSGHVVAEFQDSTGWHLMDPDKEAYFTRPNGKIASYEEIVDEDVALKIHRTDKFQKPSIGQQIGLYSDVVVENELKTLTRSTNDNRAFSSDSSRIAHTKPQFLLSGSSSITYSLVKGGGAIKAVIKVCVPPRSKGKMYLPLTCVIVEKSGDSAQLNFPYKNLVNTVFPKDGITFEGSTKDTLQFWFLASGIQQTDSNWSPPILQFRSFAHKLSGNWVNQMLFASRISQVLTATELERINQIERSLGNISCIEKPEDLIRVYDDLLIFWKQNGPEFEKRRQKLERMIKSRSKQITARKGESSLSDFDLIKCSPRAIAASIFLLTETSVGN